MNIDQITGHILQTCQDSRVHVASKDLGDPEMSWGDRFFYAGRDAGPEANKQMPFATIVTKDYGEFDNASNLDRPGVFRLNIGVSAATFARLFNDQGSGMGKGVDFAALDRLFPHPVYAAQHFVCIINPTTATFHRAVGPLIAQACDLAARRTR
jgi:hypothetical protein